MRRKEEAGRSASRPAPPRPPSLSSIPSTMTQLFESLQLHVCVSLIFVVYICSSYAALGFACAWRALLLQGQPSLLFCVLCVRCRL